MKDKVEYANKRWYTPCCVLVFQLKHVLTTISPVHHAFPTVQQQQLLCHSKVCAVLQLELVVTWLQGMWKTGRCAAFLVKLHLKSWG